MKKELRKTKVFHKKKKHLPKWIMHRVDDHEIIYGARALNIRFPNFLDEPTTDIDVYTKTPHKDAKETEQYLDKRFGGDYFSVEQAVHPNTYRVRSNINDKVYADYTKPDRKVRYQKIKGHKYATLGFIKQHIKRTLRDPEASFRWKKDQDAYNRIMLFEKYNHQKRKQRDQTYNSVLINLTKNVWGKK